MLGFGRSIIVQGSALLIFDSIMYFVHQRHGKKLFALADKIQIGLTASGIGCTVAL